MCEKSFVFLLLFVPSPTTFPDIPPPISSHLFSNSLYTRKRYRKTFAIAFRTSNARCAFKVCETSKVYYYIIYYCAQCLQRHACNVLYVMFLVAFCRRRDIRYVYTYFIYIYIYIIIFYVLRVRYISVIK